MAPIKTALLSFGMSGKVFHAPFLRLHKGFELVGAWERSTKNIQNQYPATKSYASFEDLLQDDIELVVVNTPIETHFEYAKKALLANKHVLVEKAFTRTAAEATELLQLAKERNLKLAVYHNRRWDSDFKTVQKILTEGKLGKIIEAEFHFDRYNPLLSPKKHKETPSLGAGILKDLGSHLIDQSVCLFGMPQAVFANIKTTRNQSLIDDWFDLQLFYSDFTTRLKASFFVKEPHPAYTIHGTNGSFLKARGDVQEDQLKLGKNNALTTWGTEKKAHQGILHLANKEGDVRIKIKSLQGNYMDFYESLYQSIRHYKTGPVTAQDGLNVMLVIEAALKSHEEKKTIAL
jgi:scyllo-inositol 2-dehydrogenase (NADP+)